MAWRKPSHPVIVTSLPPLPSFLPLAPPLPKTKRQLLPLIPRHAIIKLYTISPEAIQCAANREIYLAPAQPLDQFQILQMPPPTSIRDGDRTPFCQPLHQLLIDALLQALIVSCMDEKLGAVWLQGLNRLCREKNTW